MHTDQSGLSDVFLSSPSPDKPSESTDRLLQERFRKLGLYPEAFSSIHYRGTRTFNPPTDFSGLLRSLEQQLDNNTTRSPRSACVIYKALQVMMPGSRQMLLPANTFVVLTSTPLRQALSESFSGDIPDEHITSNSFFPDEYFTCSSICLSCGFVSLSCLLNQVESSYRC